MKYLLTAIALVSFAQASFACSADSKPSNGGGTSTQSAPKPGGAFIAANRGSTRGFASTSNFNRSSSNFAASSASASGGRGAVGGGGVNVLNDAMWGSVGGGSRSGTYSTSIQ